MHEASRNYLLHLGKAYQKINQRDAAKRKLELELAALRRIGTPVVRKQLARLEHAIHETVKSEKKILAKQHEEDELHAKFAQKILAIDDAVNKAVKTGIEKIEKEVRELEESYSKELGEKKARKHREILAKIKEKIKRLKK